MARDLAITPCENEPYYFISYNSEDNETVKEYVQRLEKRGVPMWYDGGIRLGDNWNEKLIDKIRASQGVIMFLSKNMAQKENSYVVTEFKIIKEFSQTKIYYVILDKVDGPTLPAEYVPLWLNATETQGVVAYEDGPELAVDKLIKELGHAAYKLEESTDVKKRRVEFENGDVYDGDWENGYMHGKGAYIWSDGDRYEGDFKKGYRSGKGKYVWGPASEFKGDVYEGDFLKGDRTGIGTYTWGNESKYAGDKYEGAFYCGTKFGKGVYTFASGAIYDGSFVDDEITGKGIYIYKDGSSYSGEVKNGKRHGKGLRYYKNCTLEGNFVDGELDGYGVLTYADKSCYEGMFSKGKKHGKGVLKDAKGKIIYKGIFVNDKQKIN